MTNLAEVADLLRKTRKEERLTQEEVARLAGVSRSTIARMEGLTSTDMSVSALVRIAEGMGYDLQLVKRSRTRTIEDILEEQRHWNDE